MRKLKLHEMEELKGGRTAIYCGIGLPSLWTLIPAFAPRLIKIYLGKILMLFVTLTISSCSDTFKEHQEDPTPNKSENHRLNFVNADALQAAMKQYHQAEDKEEALNTIIKIYTVNGNKEGFTSLQAYKKDLELVNQKKKENYSSRTLDKGELSADSLGSLVPDPAFASVLNDDLEIQVGSNLYKITPNGTFYTAINNQEKLNQILKDGYSASNEKEVNENLYAVTDDVFRYDTYACGTKFYSTD